MSDLTPPPEGENPDSDPGRGTPDRPPPRPPAPPPPPGRSYRGRPSPPPRPPPPSRPPPNYGYKPELTDRFGRPLAAWWQRLVAIIVDVLILGVPKSIIGAIFINTAGSAGFYTTTLRAGEVVLGIVFAAVDVAYFALLNGSEQGQTLGQMMLGISVRDAASGGAVGWQRAGIRILVLYPGLALGWLPLVGSVLGIYTLVAALSPLWDSRRQGFHDKVTRTDVVKVR